MEKDKAKEGYLKVDTKKEKQKDLESLASPMNSRFSMKEMKKHYQNVLKDIDDTISTYEKNGKTYYFEEIIEGFKIDSGKMDNILLDYAKGVKNINSRQKNAKKRNIKKIFNEDSEIGLLLAGACGLALLAGGVYTLTGDYSFGIPLLGVGAAVPIGAYVGAHAIEVPSYRKEQKMLKKMTLNKLVQQNQ